MVTRSARRERPKSDPRGGTHPFLPQKAPSAAAPHQVASRQTPRRADGTEGRRVGSSSPSGASGTRAKPSAPEPHSDDLRTAALNASTPRLASSSLRDMRTYENCCADSSSHIPLVCRPARTGLQDSDLWGPRYTSGRAKNDLASTMASFARRWSPAAAGSVDDASTFAAQKEFKLLQLLSNDKKALATPTARRLGRFCHKPQPQSQAAHTGAGISRASNADAASAPAGPTRK